MKLLLGRVYRGNSVSDFSVPDSLGTGVKPVAGFIIVLFLIAVHFPEGFQKLVLNFAVKILNRKIGFAKPFLKFFNYQSGNIKMDLFMP